VSYSDRTTGDLRRISLTACGLLALAAAPSALLGCGSASGTRAAARRTQTESASRSLEVHSTQRLARSRGAQSAGSLPQTRALPAGAGRDLNALVAALWAGAVHGSPSAAMSAFFPRSAYLQVKAIPAAGADYVDRLVHEYGLDIGAVHALLGHDAPGARLVAVHVPEGFAHWVEPGTCYNRVGYYEVPNARVVYREGGNLHSFGIASMISWRGRWYVVHLGAVLRSEDAGVVDEPASGGGTSTDSGTC
jgi:hypothetical protein